MADVGFGGLTLTTPLRLRADVEQSTPHETFRLTGGDPDWTLEVQIGEDWKPVYMFSLDAVGLEEIEPINLAIATDPASPFTHELRVALAPSGRRLARTGSSIKPKAWLVSTTTTSTASS